MYHPRAFFRQTTDGRKLAFSLIELLVVVAVIAILATVIFSTLGSVRNRTDLAKDLANLRQVHSLFMMHVGDNDGFLPVVSGEIIRGVSPRYQWKWYGGVYDEYNREIRRSPLMDYANLEDVYAFNQMTVPIRNLEREPRDDTGGSYGVPFLVNYQIMNNSTADPSPISIHVVKDPAMMILLTGSNPARWVGAGFQHNAGHERIGGIDDDTVPILWVDGHTSVHSLEDIRSNAQRWIARGQGQ